MERPPKRRRLFAPLDSELSQSFDNRHEFYDAPDELYEEESEPAYDPDQDLQQKRARLDLKLKSTFESIFEKYGKDFEGVGDEIDLYTGEILVDNGHIQQMQNERDAGTIPSRPRRIQRTLAEEDDSVEGDYFEHEEDEDEEDEEEDYDNDDALSDEDMVEDDLILRGFAQARQFMESRPALQQSVFDTRLGRRKEPRENAALHPTRKSAVLPSRSNILSQFGPQLGPEIVRYVAEQGALEDDNIEPMWRVPPIWTTTSGKRPITKPTALPPELERPISPDNSPSIWAPLRSRFLAEEDKMLQEFVTNARRVGLDLSNDASWEKLEDMVSKFPPPQSLTNLVNSIRSTSGSPGRLDMRKSSAIYMPDMRMSRIYPHPRSQVMHLGYRIHGTSSGALGWALRALPRDAHPNILHTTDQPGLEGKLRGTRLSSTGLMPSLRLNPLTRICMLGYSEMQRT